MTRLWKVPVAAAALYLIVSPTGLGQLPALGSLPLVGPLVTQDAQGSAPARPGASRPGGHFEQLSMSGRPAYWGHCGGTVAVNPAGMSPATAKAVTAAARQFVTFTAGRWAVTQTRRTSGSGSTIVVRADTTPDRTGALGQTHSSIVPAGGVSRITDSTVHLSSSAAWDGPLAREVTLHELAHAVGAAHSKDRADVTYPYASGEYATYTASEASGLAAVSGRTC